MTKASVAIEVNYYYEVEVPNEIMDTESTAKIVEYCDDHDPVLNKLRTAFALKDLTYDAEIVSIYNDDTGARLY